MMTEGGPLPCGNRSYMMKPATTTYVPTSSPMVLHSTTLLSPGVSRSEKNRKPANRIRNDAHDAIHSFAQGRSILPCTRYETLAFSQHTQTH